MTCREASNLLPLFVDGELDSRQMRAIALHGTRCGTCESELRRMNRLQELVAESISSQVDEIDFTDFWAGVERRLGTVRVPWWQRAAAWWSAGEQWWPRRLPAFAAAAAIVALMLLLFGRTQPTSQPGARQIAAVDNAASIEALETDVDSVAVLSDPETRTTVLWVTDDEPPTGDVP